MKMTYHFLYVKYVNPTVTAFTPDNVMLLGLDKSVRGLDTLPFEFTLGKLTTVRKGLESSFDLDDVQQPIWPDYLNSTLAVGLFSRRFRDVVRQHLTGLEDIDWIRCHVTYRSEAEDYFMLRFLSAPDVVDHTHSLYAHNSDHILIPAFCAEKISKVSVFPRSVYFTEIPSLVIVRNDIRLHALREGLTGMSFKKLTNIF